MTINELAEQTGLDMEGFDPLKEQAYIKKIGKQFCIFSENGKRLGCYSSRRAAERRLKQIEIFKHIKSGEEVASSTCRCLACDSEFQSRKPCYQAVCPSCGEQDDIIEITGIMDDDD